MKRSAAAYKSKSGFVFESYSKTTVGVWIGSEPIITFNNDTPVKKLGDTIIRVLSESKTDVPHPKDSAEWKAIETPLLKIFNAKSFSSAMKGVMSCGIEEEGGFLSIKPTRNMGAKGGFVPILGKEINIPSDSDSEAIGNALLTGFELCK
jgi:hypothetical protein